MESCHWNPCIPENRGARGQPSPASFSWGVIFLPSFQRLLVTMRNESLSCIKLQTEDMRNFQSFLGRKRGHTLNSHHVFPSLPSVGRNAPGKACASSVGPGPTLVPCPEETWKYRQLYFKSQTSKSLCFPPKRKE